MSNFNSPEEIERMLLLHKMFKDQDPQVNNLPTFKKLDKNTFNQEVASADYSSYVSSGDYHYGVGRLLFQFRIWEYALFCSQQAIENYLKAYIKLHDCIPPATHSLNDLLEECRKKNSDRLPFIDSKYLEIIVQKFDPFNEVARYPVQRTRPSERGWMGIYPDDMYILDYFIFKMREIIQLPANHCDIFQDGHHKFAFFESSFPDIYRKIKENNINFQGLLD